MTHLPKPDLFLERLRLMDASKPHTYREIAKAGGVSYQAVEQIAYKAIRKLRWRLRNELEAMRL